MKDDHQLSNDTSVTAYHMSSDEMAHLSVYRLADKQIDTIDAPPYDPVCIVGASDTSPVSDASAPDGTIAIYGTARQSIVDGPGLRYAVFTQGCRHACPECHNGDSWDFDGSVRVKIDDIVDEMEGDPLCHGLSISGGDPFYRIGEVKQLISRVRERIGSDVNVWIWSGFLYEELMGNDMAKSLLDMCDVLVDGPYVAALHTPDLMWRGSSNQRVIDLHKSTPGTVVCIPLNDEGDKPKRRLGYHPTVVAAE